MEGQRHDDAGSGHQPRVTLRKGAHRWTFRCAPGQEAKLLVRLTELAEDGVCGFDWFDAAVISHEVSRRIGWRPATFSQMDPVSSGPNRGGDAG